MKLVNILRKSRHTTASFISTQTTISSHPVSKNWPKGSWKIQKLSNLHPTKMAAFRVLILETADDLSKVEKLDESLRRVSLVILIKMVVRWEWIGWSRRLVLTPYIPSVPV